MKKRLLVLGLVAVFLLAVGGTQAAPRLLIENGEFDFGFAPQNSMISHVFWLKSAGDDSLKILKVTPG